MYLHCLYIYTYTCKPETDKLLLYVGTQSFMLNAIIQLTK